MGQFDHVQLPMFMTAREITATHSPGDGDREQDWVKGNLETDHEVHARKLDESQSPLMRGLHGSIAAEGVHTPVHLSMQFGSQGKPEIGDGHHRVASQMASNPDRYIPVMHHESIDHLGEYIMDNE